MSKKLNKYIAAFDYIDKAILNVSFATSRGISIISFTSVIRVPVGIESVSLSLVFCLTTGKLKRLLKIAKEA